jgi:hypothetical protein
MFGCHNPVLRDFFPALLVLWSVTLVAASTPDLLAEEALDDNSSGQVSCTPDRPLTQPGTEVRVRAFVTSSPEEKLQYTWTATAGKIQSSNSEARWSLAGVLPGRYRATVVVSNLGRRTANCSVSVFLVCLGSA